MDKSCHSVSTSIENESSNLLNYKYRLPSWKIVVLAAS